VEGEGNIKDQEGMCGNESSAACTLSAVTMSKSHVQKQSISC